MEPNEDILNALDEIVTVNLEESRTSRRKRSSILKQPRSVDDDIQTENLQNKRKSFNSKRRVSFAEKFQVMEMNTGNIYDISGGSNSTQNEDLCSDSKSVKGVSRNDLHVSSTIDINVRSEDCSLSSFSRKHKIDSDSDLEPERKKINTQNFPLHLKSDSISLHPNDDLSELKTSLYDTGNDFTRIDKRNEEMELTLNWNSDLNSSSLQFNIQERHNEDGSKSVANNLSILNSSDIVHETNMSLQSRDDVQWNKKSASIIKDAVVEFDSRDPFLPSIKNDKNFHLEKELPNVKLHPLSLSDVSLMENKENIYVDVKNKSILVTNARELKLKEEISVQISKDVPILLKSQVLDKNTHLIASETDPLDVRNSIPRSKIKLPFEDQKLNSDETHICNHSMDLTCVAKINITKNSEDLNEDNISKDLKLQGKSNITYKNTFEAQFKNDELNKTVFDTSHYMDLTCNPQDLTNLSIACESSVKDVPKSPELTSQQNDIVTYKNSFRSHCKNDKTVFDTSHYMDLTCNSQDLSNESDLVESNEKDISISESRKLMSQQTDDISYENSSESQLKNDKTVFDISHYMDLTCNPLHLTNIVPDLSESNMKDVSISESRKLTSQQFDDKTVYDVSHYMDLTCNPLELTDIVFDLPEINTKDVSVPKSLKLQTQQSNDVTLKNDKAIFLTSDHMDFTCNLQDLTNIVSDASESNVIDASVSKRTKLTLQQNDENFPITFTSKQNQEQITEIADTSKNQKNVVHTLYIPSEQLESEQNKQFVLKQSGLLKTLTPHLVEQAEKLTEDKTNVNFSMQLTYIPSEIELTDKLQHSIEDESVDEENTLLHSNSNTQLKNNKNFIIQEDLNDDQLNKTKLDTSHYMELTCNVKDFVDSMPSDEHSVNHVFGCNPTELSKVPSDSNLFILDANKKNDVFNKELVTNSDKVCLSESSSLLKDQAKIEMKNSSPLKTKNQEKLELVNTDEGKNHIFSKTFKANAGEELENQNLAISYANVRNIKRPNLSEQTEIHKSSFLNNQSPQKFEESIVVDTEAGNNYTFIEKGKNDVNEKFDNSNLNVSDSDMNGKSVFSKELVKDSDKKCIPVSPNSLKGQNDKDMLDSSVFDDKNLQQLGEYMFLNNNAEKNQKFSRNIESNAEFDNYDSDLSISVTNIKKDTFGKELVKGINKTFVPKSKFKNQTDVEVGNFEILSVENLEKSEDNLLAAAETTRKSAFSRKNKNKTDEEFDCYKANSSASAEDTNHICNMTDAKKDFYISDSKEINSVAIKNKYANSSNPNIVYAIKQLKGMNQTVTSCSNIFTFPEVFLSVKKQAKLSKTSFSCSSIQLSKAVSDCVRQSSNFTNRELSFLPEFNQDPLSHKCNVKIDQNISEYTENSCNSATELPVTCDIPSASSSVVRSASKTIKKKLPLMHCQSPKQITSSEEADISQTFEGCSSSLNTFPGALNSVKKSLNFGNEISSNLPKLIVSSTLEKNIKDFAINETKFLDSSELFLENCSINLVTNDDSLDNTNIKLKSKITLNEFKSCNCSSLQCEELFQQSSSRISLGIIEALAPNLQNEVEKCKNVVLKDNSSVIDVEEMELSTVLSDEAKSADDLFAVNSSRLPLRQNDEDYQNISMQVNQTMLKQDFATETMEDESNKINTPRKKLEVEIRKISQTENISKGELDEKSYTSFQEKENLHKLHECTTTANEGINKNNVSKVENSAQKILDLNSSKLSKNEPKKCCKASEMKHFPCISEQSHAVEVTKGDKTCLLIKEPENNVITAFIPNSPDIIAQRKRSKHEEDSFLKENNPHELNENCGTVSMEVNENPGYVVHEKNAEEKLIWNTSKLSRSLIENSCHNSFMENQTQCVVKETHITEIAVIEKHVILNNENENEMFIQKPSKLLKIQNNEICSTSATDIQKNPSLLQESMAMQRKISESDLNGRPKDNANEVLSFNQSKLLQTLNDETPPKSLKKKKKNCRNNSHKLKQSCTTTGIEVTEIPRSNEPCKTSVGQELPLNLSKVQNDGKASVLYMDIGNLGIIEDGKLKVTKNIGKSSGNKKSVKTKKKDNINVHSNNSHDSQRQLRKESFTGESSKSQNIIMEVCTPILDNVGISNRNDYERVDNLRKNLLEASENEDCLWSLREIDNKQAVFEILGESIFACYLMYVPLNFNVETSSCAKIFFKHLKQEPNDIDEIGFSLFKSYNSPEITLSPVCTDKLFEMLSKFVDYALLAKSLIKDIWLINIGNIISIDLSQAIPKLTVEVLNLNHFSLFSLTFFINLKSYPQEKIIPKIEHLDDAIINNETILNALKEIQPGKNYLYNMVEAALAL